MQVMRILGPALPGLPCPEAGKFVQTYEATGEHGKLTVTDDIAKAKKYKDKLEAMEEWRRLSNTHPRRPDGQPNRPLAAFTVEVVPVVPRAPEPRS